MRRMCRWVSGIFAAVLLIGLCGCGGGNEKEPAAAGEIRDAGIPLESRGETGAGQAAPGGEASLQTEEKTENTGESQGAEAVHLAESGVTGTTLLTMGAEGIVMLTDKMMFYDYQTGTAYPLCNRPNCRHDSDSECAAVLGKATQMAFLYEGDLYYFDSAEEGWALYRADVSGENRRELAVFEFSGVGGTIAVTDGKLYLGLEEYTMEDPDDDRPAGCEILLLEVDLETGDTRTLLKCEGAGDSRILWTPSHVYDGRVYMTVESRGATGGDILEEGIYAIDPASGQVEPVLLLEEPGVAAWRCGRAVYYQRTTGKIRLNLLDLETGETKELTEASDIPAYGSVLLDDAFAWREADQWKVCSFSDGTVKEFRDLPAQAQALFPEEVFVKDGREMIFGESYSKKETGEAESFYAVLSAEAFLADSTDYQVVCESGF